MPYPQWWQGAMWGPNWWLRDLLCKCIALMIFLDADELCVNFDENTEHKTISRSPGGSCVYHGCAWTESFTKHHEKIYISEVDLVAPEGVSINALYGFLEQFTMSDGFLFFWKSYPNLIEWSGTGTCRYNTGTVVESQSYRESKAIITVSWILMAHLAAPRQLSGRYRSRLVLGRHRSDRRPRNQRGWRFHPPNGAQGHRECQDTKRTWQYWKIHFLGTVSIILLAHNLDYISG